MLDLFIRIYKSPGFKLTLRLFASLASAVFVVTGFVFLQGKRQAPSIKPAEEEEDDDNQDPPNPKVHFLYKN
ncbi:MAG: hypothetical protein RRB13_14145 [bacterium]|nr:hypothetical protein [bacterium]